MDDPGHDYIVEAQREFFFALNSLYNGLVPENVILDHLAKGLGALGLTWHPQPSADFGGSTDPYAGAPPDPFKSDEVVVFEPLPFNDFAQEEQSMGINVRLVPALAVSDVTATAEGSEVFPLGGDTSDPRVAWFGINDDVVSKFWHSKVWSGGVPPIGGWHFTPDGDVVVDRNLTILVNKKPPFDVYNNPWNKPKGQRKGTVVEVTPDGKPSVHVSKQAALLDHRTFHNGLDIPQDFKAEISLERKDSVSNEWSKETTVGQSLTVGVEVAVEGVGGAKTEATFSYEVKEGESHSVSREIGLGQKTEIHGKDIAPGDWVMAAFAAYQGNINVQVPVQAKLSGYITIWAPARHWWNLHDENGGYHPKILSVSIPLTEFYYGARQWGVGLGEIADLNITSSWYTDTLAEILPIASDDPDDLQDAVVKALAGQGGVDA